MEKKMTHGMYHYIKQAWKKPDKKTLRERMTEWRKSDVLTKVEKPLRLDRARALGYKDKKGEKGWRASFIDPARGPAEIRPYSGIYRKASGHSHA